MTRAVDQLLERDRGRLLVALVEAARRACASSARIWPAVSSVRIRRCGSRSGRLLIASCLLYSSLVIVWPLTDAGGREVVVVPRGGEGDDQEQERGDDGDAEADVEEHRAAVPIVPGAGVLAGRPAAERRHGVGGSSWYGAVTATGSEALTARRAMVPHGRREGRPGGVRATRVLPSRP